MFNGDVKKLRKKRTKKLSKTTVPFQSIGDKADIPCKKMSDQDKLMEAETDSDPSPAHFSKGANPYLGGERCLLCRCERPDPMRSTHGSEKPHNIEGLVDGDIGSLHQLPLWVCPECRKTVEEEERKATMDANSIRESLPQLNQLSEGAGSSALCSCETCLSRRHRIVEDNLVLTQQQSAAAASGELNYNIQDVTDDVRALQKEMAALQSDVNAFSTDMSAFHAVPKACRAGASEPRDVTSDIKNPQMAWIEMRHVVRCIYSQRNSLTSQPEDDTLPGNADVNRMKEIVALLVSRDPHQLYQRLESQAREYTIESRVRLLKQLTAGAGVKTPPQARTVMALLLDEYANLCAAGKLVASCIVQLEKEHLKRFNLTWELHNKHLFQSIVYKDTVIQNNLPAIMTLLRVGAASKEAYHEDTYPNILHRYLKMDDEMSVVSVVWRECQQLLEAYNDIREPAQPLSQAALKAKQKLLKEDWQFFKEQRRVLEQALKHNKCASNANFEQLSQTMMQIMHGEKSDGCSADPGSSSCTHQRCSCDECTISHMITCGIMSSEDTEAAGRLEALHLHHQGARYGLDVTPPSVSSTDSSDSDSASPLSVEPQHLAMPPYDGSPEQLSDKEDGDGQESDDAADDADDEDDVDDDVTSDCCQRKDQRVLPESMQQRPAAEGVSDVMAPPDSLTPHCQAGADGPSGGCNCPQCLGHYDAAASATSPGREETCQCHECLKQLSQAMCTSLPQPPAAPRPSALTLYPHIHGRAHRPPGPFPLALPTQLYAMQAGGGALYPEEADDAEKPPEYARTSSQESSGSGDSETSDGGPPPPVGLPLQHPPDVTADVTAPLQHAVRPVAEGAARDEPARVTSASPASGITASNLLMGFDSHQALHDHLYNAYGDWDDKGCRLLSGVDHDMYLKPADPGYPAPPCTSQASTAPFNSSVAKVTETPVVEVSAASSGSPACSGTGLQTPLTSEHCMKNLSVIAGRKILHPSPTRASRLAAQQHKKAGEPTTQSPVPGGLPPPYTVMASLAASLPASVTSSTSTSGVTGDTMADHFLKNNPFLHTHHSSFATSAPLPPSLAPPLPARGSSSAGAEGCSAVRSLANFPPPACSHQAPGFAPAAPQCAGGRSLLEAPPAPPVCHAHSNVGTACPDPDCDGNHDEYDSIDDSCSEQSSSASNQKDCKYCNCCYCEFFGHSNPPQAPTSRNYHEMRDRLRLRLKRKNELKEGQGKVIPEPRPQMPVSPVRQPLEVTSRKSDQDVDQLVEYINGDDNKEAEKAANKAAKRLRQKQRKAEEKARKERERLEQEEAERQQAALRAAEAERRQLEADRAAQQAKKQEAARQKKARQLKEKEAKIKVDVKVNGDKPVVNGDKTIADVSKTNGQEKSPTPKPKQDLKTERKKAKQITPETVAKVTGKATVKEPVVVEKNHKLKNGQRALVNGDVWHEDAGSRKMAGARPLVPGKTAGRKMVSVLKPDLLAEVKVTQAQLQQENQRNAAATNNNNTKREDVKTAVRHEPAPGPNKTEEPAKPAPSTPTKQSPPSADRSPPSGGKKKNRRRNRGTDTLAVVDEIFLPKDDVEEGEMDDLEKELEEFKRFCMDSQVPANRREKVQVNVDLKSVFKKKSSVSCA